LIVRMNISVPDDLAGEVRRRGIAISAVCQRALRDEVNGGSVNGTKCARCLAGLCDHQGCGPAGKVGAVTDVAGTSCCAECAPVLLELVLHSLRVMPADPENLARDVEERLTRRASMQAMRGPGGNS
jgi:hypothetical protein